MATQDARPVHVLVCFNVPEALRDLLQGLISYVRDQNRDWRLRCTNSLDEFFRLLKEIPTDGALTAMDRSEQARISAAGEAGLPVVNIVHDCHPLLPSVVSNERSTGRLAAQNLLGRGYRHFAYLGYDVPWSRERHRGFAEALGGAGRPCHVCPEFERATYYNFLDTSGAAARAQAWMASLPKPIAVLVCGDHYAATALEIWTAAGVRVPEDAAVMGVGNLMASCELAPVPLSSVAVDFPALGYHAARTLDGLMAGDAPPGTPFVVEPPGVITRRSTDAFMFDDEHVRAAMRIIHDRGTGGLTIKELLREVPVSRQWLDLQFKALVGHTPSREIRNLRLEYVRELLVNTDLSVQQITNRSGFTRIENLIRFFRQAYGVPPNVYRLEHGAHVLPVPKGAARSAITERGK